MTHAATQATDVFLRFQLSLSTFSGTKIFWLLHIFEKKMRVVFVREAYYVNIYSLFGLSCELDIQSLAILLAFVHLYIVAIAFLQSPYMHLKEAPIPILHFLTLLETYVPKIVANS